MQRVNQVQCGGYRTQKPPLNFQLFGFDYSLVDVCNGREVAMEVNLFKRSIVPSVLSRSRYRLPLTLLS